MNRRILVFFLGIILLAAVAIWVDLPSNPGLHLQLGSRRFDRDIEVRLGLDLQGGLRVVLEAAVPPDQPVERQSIETVKGIIERRVNALGVSEPQFSLLGDRRISVELPGVSDPDQAIATFRQTGLLEFVHTGPIYLEPRTLVTTTEELGIVSPTSAPTSSITPGVAATPTLTPASTPTTVTTPMPTPTVTPTIPITSEGTVFQTILTGKHIKSADIKTDQLGLIQVTFTLDEEGASIFADYTAKNVGQIMCIVLDKEVVSCATINEPIPTGEVLLRRQQGFPLDEAQSIVIRLRYGALPIPLRVAAVDAEDPTLGPISVQKSLVAGVIGLSIVVAFMLIYYRLPGLLADLALGIYAAIVLALFKLIPVVLTLAGIAGFILSIGMAVDANILIFERLKEELRAGKGLHLAVEQGFRRAWPSIRDSNISTLITCIILWWFGDFFGASIVKGFATTLFLGVIVSMFTAILVTRTFLRLVMDLDIAKTHWWFGV